MLLHKRPHAADSGQQRRKQHCQRLSTCSVRRLRTNAKHYRGVLSSGLVGGSMPTNSHTCIQAPASKVHASGRVVVSCTQALLTSARRPIRQSASDTSLSRLAAAEVAAALDGMAVPRRTSLQGARLAHGNKVVLAFGLGHRGSRLAATQVASARDGMAVPRRTSLHGCWQLISRSPAYVFGVGFWTA